MLYVDPDGHQGVREWFRNQAKAAKQTVLNTIEGAASAYAEDNGFGGTTGPQNKVGRFAGHGLALLQGSTEVYAGIQTITAGGAEAIATAPACASGVGCAAPAVGVTAVAGGAVLTAHGTLVIGQTLNNIFSKNTSAQQPKEGSQGGPGAGKNFSESTKSAERAASNNSCRFCSTQTTRNAKPAPTRSNIDHAVPKSRGGNNTAENAQNTCQTCNLKKGTKTTKEFLNQ